MVTQNCLQNKVCKKDLTTTDHVYRFNIVSYIVCIIIFAAMAISGAISFYTVAIGLVFGVITALSNYYKMRALSVGPMHITLLITTASMIIPTMSGVFFGEDFSFPKLVAVLVLIFFIYLTLDGGSGGGRINKKWFIYCLFAFVLAGSIGVLQKVHQSSEHKGEIGAFLCIAFICSLAYSALCSRKSFGKLRLSRKQIIFALVCGLCTFLMNYINLKLSGLIPSQLFFPLINGSTIVLSSLLSVAVFKERLNKKQIIGLCGGILSLIAICLV